MNRAHYEKEQLLSAFEEIGAKTAEPITAYLFGGGAMAFRDQKGATKDLDIAFLNNREYAVFTDALEKSGFHKIKVVEKAYVEMEASSMWERQDGFRIDLFVKLICKKLEVSQSMVKRSEEFRSFGKLTVKMLSNEDLVLLKGITERDRDESDIAEIIRKGGIDWKVVLSECISQSTVDKWYIPLFNKFYSINQKYGIESPILGQLENYGNRAILVQFYKDKREEGKPHEEIMDLLKEYGFTQDELKQLETDLRAEGQ